MHSPGQRADGAPTLLFWFALALALGLQLGGRGLNEPDEGRATGIAREMRASGDWAVPRLFDHAHLNKPPLLYWTLCASFAAAGENETAARFPAAAAAFGTLLLTAALARRLGGAGLDTLAPLLLIASPLFFVLARLIDYNMLLTFWTTLSWWAAWAWMCEGRPRHRALFYLGLALAFLTKGPVGPVLVLGSLALYRWRAPPAMPWRSLWHTPLALAAAAVSLSWYLVLASRHPELWRFFLGDELVDRVFTDAHARGGSPFFYLFMIPVAVLPWMPLLAGALRRSLRDWRAHPGLRLAWSVVAVGFVLFTLARSKMPTYVLPLLPLLVIALAVELRRRLDDGNASPFLRGAIVLGGGTCVIGFAVAGRAAGWPAIAPWVIAQILLLGAALLISFKRRFTGAGAAAAALLCIFHVTHRGGAAYENSWGPHTSVRACAAALAAEWEPGDRVALLTRYPRGLAFYFRGPISVLLEKFPLQLKSDRARVAGKDFADPAEIFRAFDSTGRVFIVSSEVLLAERQRDAKRPVHVLYRDQRFILMSNEP